jgi:hypothetical protein
MFFPHSLSVLGITAGRQQPPNLLKIVTTHRLRNMSCYAAAAQNAARNLNLVLEAAGNADPAQVLATPGRFLGSAISIYTELLRGSGCQTFGNLKSAWEKSWARDPDLRDAIEEVWSAEDRWDEFLRRIDADSCHEKPLHVVADVPRDAPLVDVRTEVPVKLSQLLEGSATDRLHLILLRHFA